MKVKDLIRNKDYDCIFYRFKMLNDKNGRSLFIGKAASKDGQLISLDGDTIYDEEDVVFEYEEWSSPKDNIKNGLTIVVEV